MNGLGYAAIVACAEVARDRDACAHGKPRKEADEQEDERPGRTDGRQRLIAEKPADDQRVRRIVKLLKDLTEEHGNGKLRDQLPRTAFRHIQRTSAQGASFPSVQRQLTRYLSVKNTASTAVIFSIPEIRTKSKPLSSRHIQKSGGPVRSPALELFQLRINTCRRPCRPGLLRPPLRRQPWDRACRRPETRSSARRRRWTPRSPARYA